MGNTKDAKFQRQKDPRSSKRRKYHGNQRSADSSCNSQVDLESGILNTETLSASARKISRNVMENMVNNDKSRNGYVLFDINILTQLIHEIGKCTLCNSHVEIQHKLDQKKGLCNFFEMKCTDIKCPWTKTISTSNHINKTVDHGKIPYDVNVRTIMAFREIGKGYAGIESFCGYMNMPPPMAVTTYHETIANMHSVYMECAEFNMKAAANEIREELLEECTAESIADVDVSVDGTWQRRGFSSLNGAVTVISLLSGKCLAFEALTKTCKACQVWEKRKDTPEYYTFFEKHECIINHTGSAGSMEPAGVLKCFEKSLETRKLRYANYIGDGDSKAYNDVVKADPYKGFRVMKGECVGHIQKRVGSRLRKLKKEYGGIKLSDGKGLRGRLGDKEINKLQNYFGIAIRKNSHSVQDMQKSIGAVLYHCSETIDPDARHIFCDKTDGTWCKYQKAKLEGKDCVDKPGIPIAIKEIISPIFMDLSKPELLIKCLHGKTQNNNECLNGVIWKRLPKDIFVNRTTLEMGICSALINFNDGAIGFKTVLEKLFLLDGYFTNKYCLVADQGRIKASDRKSMPHVKKDRKRLHAKRKGYGDKDLENEGETYAPGGF